MDARPLCTVGSVDVALDQYFEHILKVEEACQDFAQALIAEDDMELSIWMAELGGGGIARTSWQSKGGHDRESQVEV